jgi:hypothetical protein
MPPGPLPPGGEKRVDRRIDSDLVSKTRKCAYERICSENLLCTCNRGNAAALANARCCRHPLSDPAMSCVRRYRLYPDPGAVRDRGAILSPQVIPGGGPAAVLLLLSVVLAGGESPRKRRRQPRPWRQGALLVLVNRKGIGLLGPRFLEARRRYPKRQHDVGLHFKAFDGLAAFDVAFEADQLQRSDDHPNATV